MTNIPFRQALVSVSDKTGLVEFLKPLAAEGLKILSTGGTARHLREHGLQVTDVSDYTGFPEVMDGRVKTLHPRVHMALLGRSANAEDMALLKKEGLEPIDLVVVNLYPFEAQLGKTAEESELIEYIDIGGPSMLRSAAKNFDRISVVCDPKDYDEVKSKGAGDIGWRRHLAAKVFAHVSSYDAMIATELGHRMNSPEWSLGGGFVQQLRYGENPHQQAVWFRRRGARLGLHTAQILQGKELSYNNLLDLDAAVLTVGDFQQPCAVAVKHNNPCGAAVDDDVLKAFERALKADPVSVFGGIIAVNFEVDEKCIEALGSVFLECLVAPGFTGRALELLKSRKNLRVLRWPELVEAADTLRVRSVLGGFLVQSADSADDWDNEWKVLGRRPDDAIKEDLTLAWKVAGRLKSNAIAIAGGGSTLGLGMGQVNRVDAVQQAITRWRHFHPHEKHGVLASDAFFPFADSIDHIAEAGIKWVIQPGGSLRDQEVIARAAQVGINMVLTGKRHFAH
jgi:phosphoribosylaminoimidazolecarboxamide formyltransferase / IMP cyclohydrolase